MKSLHRTIYKRGEIKMIKLVRLDHRLLQGQVGCTWSQNIGADCILIASDGVAGDDLRKTTYALAKPVGIKLVVKNVADSIRSINSGVTDKYKLLVLVEDIDSLYRLASGCPQITAINLGGLKQREGSYPISGTVFITKDEGLQLQELLKMGKEMSLQQVPTETPIKVTESMLTNLHR